MCSVLKKRKGVWLTHYVYRSTNKASLGQKHGLLSNTKHKIVGKRNDVLKVRRDRGGKHSIYVTFTGVSFIPGINLELILLHWPPAYCLMHLSDFHFASHGSPLCSLSQHIRH